MVPKAGLEPARLAPLPPQDSVSTNSTTWAKDPISERAGPTRLGSRILHYPLTELNSL